jgi:hypothetical protein
MRKHVDLNVVFPYSKMTSLLVPETNVRPTNDPAPTSASEIVETQNNDTSKTSCRLQSEVVVVNRAASGSNPVSGPTANSTHPGADGTSPTASGGSTDPARLGLKVGLMEGRSASSQ